MQHGPVGPRNRGAVRGAPVNSVSTNPGFPTPPGPKGAKNPPENHRTGRSPTCDYQPGSPAHHASSSRVVCGTPCGRTCREGPLGGSKRHVRALIPHSAIGPAGPSRPVTALHGQVHPVPAPAAAALPAASSFAPAQPPSPHLDTVSTCAIGHHLQSPRFHLRPLPHRRPRCLYPPTPCGGSSSNRTTRTTGSVADGRFRLPIPCTAVHRPAAAARPGQRARRTYMATNPPRCPQRPQGAFDPKFDMYCCYCPR